MIKEPTEYEKKSYTEEEYFALEAAAEYKSEYRNGEIIAMSGGKPSHSRLGLRIGYLLESQLEGGNCNTYNSDLRIGFPENKVYFYPDCSVICGDLETAEGRDDVVINPTLIVEVLSESTEHFDRGEKFAYYRKMPSFQEYVLINQHKKLVEVFSRIEDKVWQMRTYEVSNPEIELRSLEISISLEALYQGVEI